MDEYERSSCGPSQAIMMAFVAGAAVGAIAAILLAPQSGQESRDQLKGYANRTGEGLRDATEKAGETFQTAMEKGRDIVREQTSVVKEAMEAGRQAMRQARPEEGREKSSGV
jgi:gas vesicle protein